MQILRSGGKRLALRDISPMWSSPIFPNYLGSWFLTARGKNNTPTLVGTPQFWKNHLKNAAKPPMLHQSWRESFRKRQGPDTCGRYDFYGLFVCLALQFSEDSFGVVNENHWTCQVVVCQVSWKNTLTNLSTGRVNEDSSKKRKWMALLWWGQGLVPQPNSPVREEFPSSEDFPTLLHTIQSAKITPLPVEPSSHLKAT